MAKVHWTPSAERAGQSTMAKFETWLQENRNLSFEDYDAMWRWSIDDLEGFWSSIWEYFDVVAEKAPETFLNKREMPGAEWGKGGMLNYADQVLRHAEGREDALAIVVRSETFGRQTLSWAELRQQVASVAARLTAMGVVVP